MQNEGYYYPNKLALELESQILAFVHENKNNEAIKVIDDVIAEKYPFDGDMQPLANVHLSALYLEVAEAIIATLQNDDVKVSKGTLLVAKSKIIKMMGLFNQSSSPFINELFTSSNRARGKLLLYDIDYIIRNHLNNQNRQEIRYNIIDSIYSIELISEAIAYYWSALSNCNEENESYSIRNNLANALSRAGRYLEAINLYKINVESLPNRWQSYASYADTLGLLIDSGMLYDSSSLYMTKAELYTKSIADHQLPVYVRNQIAYKIAIEVLNLENNNFNFNKDTITRNKEEEQADYEKFTQHRKFTLSNSLGLNEHSIYCFCSLSEIDNLKIGLPDGSTHVTESLLQIDGLVNRVISEYAYSRKLYFDYNYDSKNYLADVEFSTIKDATAIDVYGYHIEDLRTSYRLAYSILDKLGNGILLLYGIKVSVPVYFENLFSNDIVKSVLRKKNNIHLCTLYSLSSNLNKDTGAFKAYKRVRNEMEHGFYALKDGNAMNKDDLNHFTLQLLKLTRNAIFSFVFLVRCESIVSI